MTNPLRLIETYDKIHWQKSTEFMYLSDSVAMYISLFFSVARLARREYIGNFIWMVVYGETERVKKTFFCWSIWKNRVQCFGRIRCVHIYVYLHGVLCGLCVMRYTNNEQQMKSSTATTASNRIKTFHTTFDNGNKRKKRKIFSRLIDSNLSVFVYFCDKLNSLSSHRRSLFTRSCRLRFISFSLRFFSLVNIIKNIRIWVKNRVSRKNGHK